MGAEGAYEFIKWWYPQIRKEGMIVDVPLERWRQHLAVGHRKAVQEAARQRFGHFQRQAQHLPATVFYGHQVCLISETSASDGDIFPRASRRPGSGPLIGKRDWAG